VLINPSASASETVAVKASGRAAAALERLQAPSLAATSGTTLGGQSFGPDTESAVLTPRASGVPPRRGRYLVAVPAASAALLTLPR
jgi:hypothetical protein